MVLHALLGQQSVHGGPQQAAEGGAQEHGRTEPAARSPEEEVIALQEGGGSGRPPGCSVQGQVQETVQPGSLLAKLSGLDVVQTKGAVVRDVQGKRTILQKQINCFHHSSHSIVFLTEVIDSKSPGNLKPENIKMLLWCLQTSSEQTDRCRVLVTLGNAAAFSANQVQPAHPFLNTVGSFCTLWF
jgi:hypothetical protein